MPELCTNNLEAAIGDALNIMAFISPVPPEDLTPPSAPLLITRIRFSGVASGTVAWVCPQSLGALLASNCMGLEPAECESGAGDALRELLNVTCGAMLRSSGITGTGLVEMTVPTQESFDPAEWDAFVNSGAVVMDADGNKLAVHLADGQ
jgi:hypothetical protein